MATDMMEVDEPLSSNTIASSLNLGSLSLGRTLGPSTALVADVIASYRPTKVGAWLLTRS